MSELRKIAPVVVMASVLVASVVGCASTVAEPAAPGSAAPGSAASSASSRPASPPLANQQAPDESISVRISDGKVMGVSDRVEVNRGSSVRIEVTSDRSDEVHVHGYDKAVELAPGQPGVVQFVADVPGVFEVETHQNDLLLFQLVVRG